MAAVPPTGIPGAVPVGDTTFPQWGVIQTPFSVKEAKNAAEKAADEKLGYFLWFTSEASAKAQSTEKKGQVPNPLGGLAAIGAFFSDLSNANTWVRVGEGLLGLVLIAVGVARITHAVPIATSIAGKVGAVALA